MQQHIEFNFFITNSWLLLILLHIRLLHLSQYLISCFISWKSRINFLVFTYYTGQVDRSIANSDPDNKNNSSAQHRLLRCFLVTTVLGFVWNIYRKLQYEGMYVRDMYCKFYVTIYIDVYKRWIEVRCMYVSKDICKYTCKVVRC